ncbi:hypothetical protein [Proteiniphilum sp.]|uniref:hypothetical protein n=1 Tax=Proteiniphilum sp. TaxID=1926877 RepID=UPI002B21ADE3|nr:hypothetical protein [Proteiniphilum sp.]MEA4917622.1 hypothetical protein [Proteiniphilum sp.]
MEIKPVHNSRKPDYPTIELFIQYPVLLSRHIPSNWLKNKFVATSLMAFLVSGCGTGTTRKSEAIEIVDSLEAYYSDDDDSLADIPQSVVTNVAPIFAHGSGQGSTGCIVMSPPVFLSEEEAIKIILDKLAAEGYYFTRKNCPTFSFDGPPKVYSIDGVVENPKIELKMDAHNPDSEWVIQFVTTEDHYKFKSNLLLSSISRYNTKHTAVNINEQLQKQRKMNAVIFYDPIPQITNDDWQEGEKLAKKEAEKLLLAQVNDFIKWLKNNDIRI